MLYKESHNTYQIGIDNNNKLDYNRFGSNKFIHFLEKV
jgi:hypothetical protein